MRLFFGNSILSGEDSSRQSGLIAKLLKPIFNRNGAIPDARFEYIIRKLAHFSEFALLGLELTMFTVHISERIKVRDTVYPAFAGLLCANTDELIQLFSGRGSMVSDVFIDFSGVLFGIAIGYLLTAALRALRQKGGREKKG